MGPGQVGALGSCPSCPAPGPGLGVGYGHGTLPYQSISPEDGGGGGVWPQISGNEVLPYYYDYPLEPILFPAAADGSPSPPVVTAEVWAHVSPSNHQPVVPAAQVLARLSPSNHHPLPPIYASYTAPT